MVDETGREPVTLQLQRNALLPIAIGIAIRPLLKFFLKYRAAVEFHPVLFISVKQKFVSIVSLLHHFISTARTCKCFGLSPESKTHPQDIAHRFL